MSDQRYYYQSRVVLNFLAKCRDLIKENEAPLLIGKVIKIIGNLLKADLYFLASVFKGYAENEPVYIIKPITGQIYRKVGSNFLEAIEESFREFKLPDLEHYENRKDRIPELLNSKIIRYLVSNCLNLDLNPPGDSDMEQHSRDYCLFFAWRDKFSKPKIESQIYTVELCTLISELVGYVINKNLLEINYLKQLYEYTRITGSLNATENARKKIEGYQDEQGREEGIYTEINWAIMEAINHETDKSIFKLMDKLMEYREAHTVLIRCALMRGWKWLRWLVEKDGNKDNKKRMETEIKPIFHESKAGRFFEKDFLGQEYQAVMDANLEKQM